MIEMMLSPSDLSSNEKEMSSEARAALDDYNQWAGSNYSYAHEEDVEKALDALLILFPQNQAIILRRAQIYFEQDKFDSARTDTTFVLTQDPTHVQALMLRVSIAHKTQQDDALLADLHRLLSLEHFLSDPDMFDDQIRMRSWRSGVYIKQKLFDLALPDLAYIIEQVEPSSEQEYLLRYYYEALNTRSKIFKAQGQLKEELDDLKALLTPPFSYNQEYFCYEPYGNVHSYSRRGLYRRSEIYVAQENYDDALRDLDAILSEDEYDAPASVLHMEVSELVVRKQILSEIEGAKDNRAIPSLKTLAKMTFFRHEVNIDTSEWVASNPMAVRTLLEDVDITPEAIHSMRELMGGLLFTETFVGKTVFDDLAMHEDATDNKKRKHDAISPTTI